MIWCRGRSLSFHVHFWICLVWRTLMSVFRLFGTDMDEWTNTRPFCRISWTHVRVQQQICGVKGRHRCRGNNHVSTYVRFRWHFEGKCFEVRLVITTSFVFTIHVGPLAVPGAVSGHVGTYGHNWKNDFVERGVSNVRHGTFVRQVPRKHSHANVHLVLGRVWRVMS